MASCIIIYMMSSVRDNEILTNLAPAEKATLENHLKFHSDMIPKVLEIAHEFQKNFDIVKNSRYYSLDFY